MRNADDINVILPNEEGNVPSNWFSLNDINVIFVNTPMSLGIVPVKLFAESDKNDKFLHSVMLFGSGPIKKLLRRFTYSSEDNLLISCGRDPVI